MKKIWCIRHGTALHNFLFKKIGTKAYTLPIYRDTCLLEEGHQQSNELSKSWKEKNEIEIVFVSPLTRTLQTARNIFQNIKMIANDDIMEYPQSLDYCNKRREKSLLQIEFPNVTYNIPEESNWGNTETLFDLKKRSDNFKEMLRKIPEKNICVVSHSSFLKEFLFGEVGNRNEEIDHCAPILFNLNSSTP